MTTVFVMAAVLLGVEGANAASALELKQPEIARNAQPVVVEFRQLPASQQIEANQGGVVKPVAYEPSKLSNVAPVTRIDANKPLLAEASPSDHVVPTPPIPSAVTTPVSKTVAPEKSATGFAATNASYSASEDYTTSCGEAAPCGCTSEAHGCNLCGGCDTCNTGCCNSGCGCGHGHGHGGFYAKHCLPSPWHAPGNMLPHIPYQALPKTYYYFRPYQMFMIPDQQSLASGWVENPALPYSNSVFDKVYAELEPVLNVDEEVVSPSDQ